MEKLLSSPEIIRIINRRKSPRINYVNHIFVSGGAELCEGVTSCLSATGVALTTSEETSFYLEQKVNLILASTRAHQVIQAKGRVVDLRKMACEVGWLLSLIRRRRL